MIAISGDWALDFRALSLLVCTQICVILSALELGSMMLGRRLIPASQPGVTLFALCWAMAIAGLNIYAIGYKNHWRQYEREFEAYSNSVKTIGCLVMVVLLGLAGATSVWLTSTMVALPR